MLSDYQTLVDDLVRDDASRITTDQRDDAIAKAVSRYSLDRPKLKVEDVAGVSGHLMALPAGWETDFSELRSIEYPIGQVPPKWLDNDRYDEYLDTDALKIMLMDAVTDATLRALYTIRHTLDATHDTIPVEHREAVAKYASAMLCDQLAAFYSNDTDSTISADSVKQTTKAQAYAAAAKIYRTFYTNLVGLKDMTSAPAGAVVNLRDNDSLNQPRIYHPPRARPLP